MSTQSKIAGVIILAGFIMAACQPPANPIGVPTSAILQPTNTPVSPVAADTAPPASLTTAATPTQSPAPTLTQTQPLAPTASATPAALPPTPSQPPVDQAFPGEAIIIDHDSVALFDQIPDEYLEKARNLRLVYYNASVGLNISQGLDCLAASSWAESPSYCRRDYTGPDWDWRVFTGNDLSAGAVPARIQFPGGEKYDRSRWIYERQPNDWQQATADFLNEQAPNALNNNDVLSYKVTYFMVDERSDILDPETGFFTEQPDRADVTDMEAFIASHPDKVVFFWTSSLSRNTGSQVALEFNQRMRDYAGQKGLILFDIADIESHTDTGTACYDNRDGVEFCSNSNECENFPDDGVQLPAICPDYTTEIEGGHLGSVSAGKIQLAKAFWVLMARIAGWEP